MAEVGRGRGHRISLAQTGGCRTARVGLVRVPFVRRRGVRGQRRYGTPPAVGAGTANDAGSARLIPTISVDQYASTLASWFRVGNGDMTTVLPNMGNYNASSWNLGFV